MRKQDLIHFRENNSTFGSTINIFESNIKVQSIKMQSNVAQDGGCFQIEGANVLIEDSEFKNNRAAKGGMIIVKN